jgi:6-phosphogluconate dehydrogenase
LRRGFAAAMIITYAQGMSLLRVASEHYGYQLKLDDVASIWRGGCIIRAALLEDIRAAFHDSPQLPNLLLDSHLGERVGQRQSDLRAVVCAAVSHGISVPALSASLSYYDGYRSAWLPANLIQAQRDYFGSHRYERVDRKGVFHTVWTAPEEEPSPQLVGQHG